MTAVKVTCYCGCGKQRGEHLCPCGCGHPYDDAVRKMMAGPMYMSYWQASSEIDRLAHVPCKWTS